MTATAGWDSERGPMPENTSERRRIHAELRAALCSLLEGEDDLIARMASAAGLLFAALRQCSFAGFYRVGPGEVLVIGPYQGPPACVRIPFGRGVCGAAAREGRSQLVPDVLAFPGHIACDAAARSELVVPVRDAAGRLLAVLDLDSHLPSAFNELDREELERTVGILFGDPAAAGDPPSDRDTASASDPAAAGDPPSAGNPARAGDPIHG